MKAYRKNGIGRRDFLQTFGAAAGIAAIGGPSFAGQARTGSETTDEKKQREIINEMLKVMYEDSPWLFMYFQPDFYGVANRVAWTPRRDEKVFIYLAKPAQ